MKVRDLKLSLLSLLATLSYHSKLHTVLCAQERTRPCALGEAGAQRGSVNSLLALCGCAEANSGEQARQQEALPAGPVHTVSEEDLCLYGDVKANSVSEPKGHVCATYYCQNLCYCWLRSVNCLFNFVCEQHVCEGQGAVELAFSFHCGPQGHTRVTRPQTNF